MALIANIKTRIREKSQDLFMQLGMRRVSMDDIANAVGMSKKTLYQYYPDKETLVADTIEGILKLNSTKCESSREKADNAIHEGFLATDAVAETLRRMHHPILIFDMQKFYPAAWRRFQKFQKEFLFNFVQSSIEWGVKDELFRDDIDIVLMSKFRIAIIGLSFQQEFYNDTNTDLVTLQREIFLLFLYGIATPKGVKLINKYKKQRLKPLTNDTK